MDEVAQPSAWVLPGVGPYGADVEVVSKAAYDRLAQRCLNAEAAALMWGRRVRLLEEGHTVELEDDGVIRALALPAAALAPSQESA